MIIAIINGTPTYVWFLLAFLVMRGLKARKDAELNIPKMMIVPSLFILWGLEKLLGNFTYVSVILLIYAIAVLVGSTLGYSLYQGNRTFFIKEEKVYRKGSSLPLVIILINFCVKYTLNVILAINTNLYHLLQFNILYALLSGVSVGLFIGGIYQAYRGKNSLI